MAKIDDFISLYSKDDYTYQFLEAHNMHEVDFYVDNNCIE